MASLLRPLAHRCRLLPTCGRTSAQAFKYSANTFLEGEGVLDFEEGLEVGDKKQLSPLEPPPPTLEFAALGSGAPIAPGVALGTLQGLEGLKGDAELHPQPSFAPAAVCQPIAHAPTEEDLTAVDGLIAGLFRDAFGDGNRSEFAFNVSQLSATLPLEARSPGLHHASGATGPRRHLG